MEIKDLKAAKKLYKLWKERCSLKLTTKSFLTFIDSLIEKYEWKPTTTFSKKELEELKKFKPNIQEWKL
jgi:tRNA splicing ligase